MDKVFVMQGVATKLWATENAMDATVAEASKLLAGIVEAREEIGCSHIVVDSSMRKVSETIAKLAEARAALVEAHNELNETKLRLGVRTTMIGTAPKYPPVQPSVEAIDRKAG